MKKLPLSELVPIAANLAKYWRITRLGVYLDGPDDKLMSFEYRPESGWNDWICVTYYPEPVYDKQIQGILGVYTLEGKPQDTDILIPDEVGIRWRLNKETGLDYSSKDWKLNLGDFFHLLDDKEFIDKMVEKLDSKEEEKEDE